jgi:hypothetical protein
MATSYSGATPKHLWVVGMLSLLWNCVGAVDYVMSETGNLAWFEMMGLGREEMAFVQSFPIWAVAVWAIGVWGSVAGSILLLMRSRHAVTAFMLSAIGAAVSFGYQFSIDKPASMEGAAGAVIPVAIMIVIVAQWYYARRQAAAGVLR